MKNSMLLNYFENSSSYIFKHFKIYDYWGRKTCEIRHSWVDDNRNDHFNEFQNNLCREFESSNFFISCSFILDIFNNVLFRHFFFSLFKKNGRFGV